MTDRQWLDVCAETDFLETDRREWTGPDGEEVIVIRKDRQYFALSNQCTHAQALMIGATIDGYEIECPLHGARFDIRSGRVTAPPATTSLKCYPVRVADGRVWIRI
ncbi:MAG: Rieske (2Fe-2S) protein [Kiritimatiellae bacterium]|nr:Rieske (2Fe-2S) protein [Kiritimatiellia bacterium]